MGCARRGHQARGLDVHLPGAGSAQFPDPSSAGGYPLGALDRPARPDGGPHAADQSQGLDEPRGHGRGLYFDLSSRLLA